jgi:hypothetical protein
MDEEGRRWDDAGSKYVLQFTSRLVRYMSSAPRPSRYVDGSTKLDSDYSRAVVRDPIFTSLALRRRFCTTCFLLYSQYHLLPHHLMTSSC